MHHRQIESVLKEGELAVTLAETFDLCQEIELRHAKLYATRKRHIVTDLAVKVTDADWAQRGL